MKKHNIAMIEYMKYIAGVYPMEMVALFDIHDFTEEEANMTISSGRENDKILCIPKTVYQTVFRSLIDQTEKESINMSDKKTLLIFAFTTGDESCKTYEVFAVLNNTAVPLEEIEDAMSSFYENGNYDDLTYEEIVETVLNSFASINWSEMRTPLNNIDCVRLITV